MERYQGKSLRRVKRFYDLQQAAPQSPHVASFSIVSKMATSSTRKFPMDY